MAVRFPLAVHLKDDMIALRIVNEYRIVLEREGICSVVLGVAHAPDELETFVYLRDIEHSCAVPVGSCAVCAIPQGKSCHSGERSGREGSLGRTSWWWCATENRIAACRIATCSNQSLELVAVSSFDSECDTEADHADHEQNSNSENHAIEDLEAVFWLEEIDTARTGVTCVVTHGNARLARGHVAESNVFVSWS